MPTGYTDPVYTKKLTFPEYAMGCARAFGALIMMRDDPADAPIPQEFFPSDYHKKALDSAWEKLTFLKGMSPAEVRLWGSAEQKKQMESLQEIRNKSEDAERIAAYQRMLAHVEAWEPPTNDHVKFKEFMADQLRQSIEGDAPTRWYDESISRLAARTPVEMHAYELAEAERSVAYHTKEWDAEVKRTRERNEWVAALRKSLQTSA